MQSKGRGGLRHGSFLCRLGCCWFSSSSYFLILEVPRVGPVPRDVLVAVVEEQFLPSVNIRGSCGSGD